MKKTNILLSFILLLALLLTSCSGPKSSVPDGSVEIPNAGLNSITINANSPEGQSDWKGVEGVGTNYVKLDDVNPDAVPEAKLGINVGIFNPIIVETDDGFLCGYVFNLDVSLVSKGTKHTPRIKKLDKTGKVVWEKDYDYEVYSGRLNNLLVCVDGSFIFSVETYPRYSDTGMIFDKSFIIKCDKDGKELWKRDFDDYSGKMLMNVFLTGKDEITAVGEWNVNDEKQSQADGAGDIVITKLDGDGNVLVQKSFGGSDFDCLNISKYDKELGIIINGRTQSYDGDFAIDKDIETADFIACIDENLNLRWVYHAEKNENLVYDQLALSDDCVYILGGYRYTTPPGFVVKLDRNGNKAWTKSELNSGLWGRTVSVLKNGDLVVGLGQQNNGIIVVLDKDGNEKKRLEELKLVPTIITPTDDGGFIVTSTREIRTVPQPLYISSIWFDTEFVAMKYSSDYTLNWRKTYDGYKDKMGQDHVFPFEDGSIVVDGAVE